MIIWKRNRIVLAELT